MLVLLVSTDLMLISSVGGAAQMAGHRFLNETRPDQLEPLLQEAQTLLCLDLNSMATEWESLVALTAPDVKKRAIAFGPHVHTARLQAAAEAGLGTVVSRGQFVSKLSQYFADAP